MTKQEAVRRRVNAAWQKYRRTLAYIPSNDLMYPAIEKRAWNELQKELREAKR